MKKKLFILSTLLIFLFSITNILATPDINLGPTLKVLDEELKEFVSDTKNIDKQIVFFLTLTNEDKDYMICWDSYSYKLEITKDGQPKDPINQQSQGKQCLAPNEKIKMWVIFDYYNEYEREIDKIGDWRFNPSITLNNNVKCYYKGDLITNKCGWNDISQNQQGNPVDIKIRKEEPSTNPEINNLIQWLRKYWKILFGGAGLIGAIVLILAIVGFFKKR